MSCQHNYKFQEGQLECSKCGHVREFSKKSIKSKILIIGLAVSVMVVGTVLTFYLF